jgi:hypothetical protein
VSYNYRRFDFIPFRAKLRERKQNGGVIHEGSGCRELSGMKTAQAGATGARFLRGSQGIKPGAWQSPMAEHVQGWREFVISFQACATADGTYKDVKKEAANGSRKKGRNYREP